MRLATIEARLAALERPGTAPVVRFDDGPRLSGPVAVLPSAFNPPTLGHLALLEAADSERQPAALLSTRNVDKGFEGAPLSHRVGMLLAIARRRPLAVLATREARIADQARALRGLSGGTRFDFVVGFDTLTRFFESAYYIDMEAELAGFFAESGLIAANRGETGVEQVETWLRRTSAAAPYRAQVEVVEIGAYPASLSSTASRANAAKGKAIGVPAEVSAYIKRHHLYRGDRK